MEIPENGRWMYQRLDDNKRWTNEFREGVFEFVQFVTSQDMFQMQGEQTRCPCKKCKCKVFKFVDDVMKDLYEKGFMPNYYWWTNHSDRHGNGLKWGQDTVVVCLLALQMFKPVQTPNTLPTAQDQPNPTFVRESIPTTPVRDASPSAPDDSVTPEYPTNPNYEHIVNERPFIRAYKGE
ncbi:hypothetical protein JHK87_027776 [Glycine soja]|nr:hypothetical protein JHK87_027776 [Glycine soja]